MKACEDIKNPKELDACKAEIAEQFDDMIENFRIDNNLREEDIIEEMKGYIKFKRFKDMKAPIGGKSLW